MYSPTAILTVVFYTLYVDTLAATPKHTLYLFICIVSRELWFLAKFNWETSATAVSLNETQL